MALEGVVAAEHLHSFLAGAPQGTLLISGRDLDFFKLLTQNVSCALSSLENDSGLKLHNILHEAEWTNNTAQDRILLSRGTVLEIIHNVKEYIVKEEMELKKIKLREKDLLKIQDIAGRNTPSRQDLLVLSSLISVARNNELNYLPSDILFNSCKLLCPTILKNMPEGKKLLETCTPNITPLFKVLRSMLRYSSVIRDLWHLSTHHFTMLETGIRNYLLGQLLQILRKQKALRKQIFAAAVCDVLPEGGKESLHILVKYQRKVHREAINHRVSRIKREAPDTSNMAFLTV